MKKGIAFLLSLVILTGMAGLSAAQEPKNGTYTVTVPGYSVTEQMTLNIRSGTENWLKSTPSQPAIRLQSSRPWRNACIPG